MRRLGKAVNRIATGVWARHRSDRLLILAHAHGVAVVRFSGKQAECRGEGVSAHAHGSTQRVEKQEFFIARSLREPRDY